MPNLAGTGTDCESAWLMRWNIRWRKKGLIDHPLSLLAEGAMSVPIATWIPQVFFFPPLVMFSPGVLYFNVFLENDLDGPDVIFGNYLLTFTLRVSSIRRHRVKGAMEKPCVRLGSSSIITPVCHLFSWFTTQRKTMCLSSSHRLVVSMMDSWSCIVKR